MQRFYIDISLWNNISIDDVNHVHQITRVLRSQIGDRVVFFNSDGFEYIYEITGISKKSVSYVFIEKTKNTADPQKHITLYQALPNKFEKIEYILQKGVEVGISKFVFFRAKRSQKLVITDKKITRFQLIIKEALEQCGGNSMPEIVFQEDMVDIPASSFVCHTKQDNSVVISDIKTEDSCNIFVWPEGGFADEEISAFQRQWAQLVWFGDRVLRTETTGIVLAFNILI